MIRLFAARRRVCETRRTMRGTTRRTFLGGAAATGGLLALPQGEDARDPARERLNPARERLNIGLVGVGGRGSANHAGHHREWLEACKTRGPTTCGVDYAGPLSEAVLLGIVAFRSGAKLEWEAAALVRREHRAGWTL